MKTRLNITIENDLLMKIKKLAKKRKTSVSALVEDHFKTLVKPRSGKSLVDYLPELYRIRKKLPKGDLVKLYYEEKLKKYGL